MKQVNLFDICSPKQWPTVQKKNLLHAGFPVFGANGLIGFFDSYTHEAPTIIIGCRGTCGSLHITPPKAYVTGNAMALDNLKTEIVDLRYLFHLLQMRGFKDVTNGVAQPQITQHSLQRVELNLPAIKEQKRITAILDQASELRRLRQHAITKLNGLGQSIFYDMFLSKANQWEKLPLSELGDVITGSTPPTSNPEHFNGDIPFVTPGDLEVDEEVRRHISILGASKSRMVEQGATFVCCIGTIGKMGQAMRASAFNQQINAVQWKDDINSEYGFYALKAKKREIVRKGKGSSTTLPILKKSEFQKIQIPVPPLELQKNFSERLGMAQIDSKLMGVSSRLLKDLFSSLQQRAFRGEL